MSAWAQTHSKRRRAGKLTPARVLACEQGAFRTALHELTEYLAPHGGHEAALVRRLAHLIARFDRAGDLERALYADCYDDDGSFNALLFERLRSTVARYERATARALAKTRHELERLELKRTGKAVPSPQIVDFNW
jgi:hypothetical protein